MKKPEESILTDKEINYIKVPLSESLLEQEKFEGVPQNQLIGVVEGVLKKPNGTIMVDELKSLLNDYEE